MSQIIWVPGKLNIADPSTKSDSLLASALQLTLLDCRLSHSFDYGEVCDAARTLGCAHFEKMSEYESQPNDKLAGVLSPSLRCPDRLASIAGPQDSPNHDFASITLIESHAICVLHFIPHFL